MNEFLRTIISGVKFLGAKMSGGRIPLQMHIRVIDRCNLHCKYCFGDYPIRNLPPPSTEQLLAVLDGLGRMGTKRVTLTGGEPLLRDDIHQVVLRARENHIEVSLTSNGVLIDRHPGLIRDLDQLTISMDGNRESHDAFRGGGSWDKAVHAIEVGRNAGTPVQLLCTATSLTKPGLPDIYALAEKYDCAVTFDLLAPLYTPTGLNTGCAVVRRHTIPCFLYAQFIGIGRIILIPGPTAGKKISIGFNDPEEPPRLTGDRFETLRELLLK